MKTRYLRLTLFSLAIAAICWTCTKEIDSFSPDGSSGKGGSMARIAIAGNYLYAVDYQTLKTFDISNMAKPVLLGSSELDFGVETIFYFKNHLFIGSTTGMYIFDISQATNPVFVAEFEHVMSCDPVVANDSLAFVTLRSGGTCRTGTSENQLDIIDITDITNPNLLETIGMTHPYGLGIDSTYIFICHGTEGIGVYQYDSQLNVTQIETISGLSSYDVIPDNKVLYVIGESGFYQYNYENMDSIYLLSSMLIGS